MTLPRKPRHALTYIELLVVLSLAALGVGLLLPVVVQARAAALGKRCDNNMRQITLAMHNYHDTYKGFPPSAGKLPDGKQASILFALLPYVEQDQVYRAGDLTAVIPLYLCPEDGSAPPGNKYKGLFATTSYASNFRVFGDGTKPARMQDIRAGTSNTVGFAERNQLCSGQPCTWGYSAVYYWAPIFAYYSYGKFQVRPAAAECDPALPQGHHNFGMQIGMLDGSVRSLAASTSPVTWATMTNPTSNNPPGPF